MCLDCSQMMFYEFMPNGDDWAAKAKAKTNATSRKAYGTSITDIGPNDTVGNNGHSGKYPLYLDMVSGMIRHNGAIGSGGIYNKEDNLNYKKNCT